MKKNWIKFFGCIAIGLAIFMSCNDNKVDPIDDDDPEETGETAYFSTLIPDLAEELGLYADGGTKAGTADEEKVTDIQVVLFDANTIGTIRYSWAMGVQYVGGSFIGPDVSSEPLPSGRTGTFTTVARLVKKQDYDMVVLINPSEKLREIVVVGNKKADFETFHASTSLSDLIGQSSGISSTTNNYRFFMCNADSYITVDEDDLLPTKKEAEEEPFEVDVERAVAKTVVINGLPTSPAPSDYAIANLTWKLDITNKKTYWMRKQGKTPSTTVKRGGGAEGKGTSDANRYAVDPNFEDISGRPSLLADEFNYLTKSDFSSSLTQTWESPTASSYSNVEYVMENTMDHDEQYQDVTTRVIIKANYIPKKTSIIEGGVALNANESYYTYMGYIIPQAKMAGYKTTPTSIPEYYPGLGKAITAATTAGKLFNGTEDSFSISGLTFYSGGMSYYKVLIRHFTDAQTGSIIMGYGRYGVVRNNVYEVTINSFSGPGDIDIPGTGGPDPEDPDPDEDEETWISANVKIKEWVVRGQNSNL